MAERFYYGIMRSKNLRCRRINDILVRGRISCIRRDVSIPTACWYRCNGPLQSEFKDIVFSINVGVASAELQMRLCHEYVAFCVTD